MPIPTGRHDPYAHEAAYAAGPPYQQAMNGQLDRGQIPNGYPPGNGRPNGRTHAPPNGMPHDAPGRGINNNNHKSLYGAYGHGNPRQSPEMMQREPSRRPASHHSGPQRESHIDPQQRPSQPRQNKFPVEHLYTFAMDRKEGVVSSEDGIRKLRLLDAKGKIWSQDVLLTITDREVMLLDEYTQETLEVFPLQDIGAISSEVKQCNYDSLLVLTVRYGNRKLSEMMMFQCEQVPAPEIARSLQRAVDYYGPGKKKRQQRSDNYAVPPPSHPHPQALSQAQVHHVPQEAGRGIYDTERDMYIPPPPDEPAPPPPIEGNVKNKVAAFAAAAAAAQANGSAISPRGFQSPKSAPVRSSESEEPIELLAMRTERDVEILNHCFDDIEAFIGRLQKAAEAYTELTRRRQTRKSRKREQGDGLLLARSRPPTDGEYIECFQKFKYCFNLLAKLKAHIHDPNAPELVHFLFVPLKLIIQSCQGPDLAASVVSPLLTPQAVELLQNCLTSRQNELWLSLGRAWTLPSTEWPKDRPVARYVPRFRDGWTPRSIPEPLSNSDISTTLLVNNASVAANAAAVAQQSPRRMSEISADQADGPGGNGAHQRHPSNDSTGLARIGSPLQRQLSNDSTGLGRTNGTGYHQRQGSDPVSHSPRSSYVTSPPPAAPKPAPHPAPTEPGPRMATAIFDFVARNSKELTIMADEQLEILNDQRKWWEVRNTSGQSGYVPSTLLKVVTPSPNTNTNSNHVPEPPMSAPPPPPAQNPYAPPPPPPPPPADNIRRTNAASAYNGADLATQLQNTLKNKQLQSRSSNNPYPDRGPSSNQHDDLHEELMRRVNNGAPKRNYRVPRRGNTDVNLTYDSGRDDVTKWLESKGFSPMTVHSLGILNGAQLFSLTKEELQQVCHDDGSRVYSQLMIQKAALQEAKNGSSELQAIMERRKVRSGSDDGVNLSSPPEFNPVSPVVFNSPGGRLL